MTSSEVWIFNVKERDILSITGRFLYYTIVLIKASFSRFILSFLYNVFFAEGCDCIFMMFWFGF